MSNGRWEDVVFHSLLVPVDFTEPNDRALEAASALVRQFGGTIHLIHVIQLIPGLGVDEERPFYSRLERSATGSLAALRARLEARGVRSEATVATGSRLGEILRAASRGTDLIVLSSHRVTPDGGTQGAGTLSHQVATFAPCPVLLVK
jgi:nucleotide-binding universal stress UspA family protein